MEGHSVASSHSFDWGAVCTTRSVTSERWSKSRSLWRIAQASRMQTAGDEAVRRPMDDLALVACVSAVILELLVARRTCIEATCIDAGIMFPW